MCNWDFWQFFNLELKKIYNFDSKIKNKRLHLKNVTKYTWKAARLITAMWFNIRRVEKAKTSDCLERAMGGVPSEREDAPLCSNRPYNKDTDPTILVTRKVAINWLESSVLRLDAGLGLKKKFIFNKIYAHKQKKF